MSEDAFGAIRRDERFKIIKGVRKWRPRKEGLGVDVRGKGATAFTADSSIFRAIMQQLADDIFEGRFSR